MNFTQKTILTCLGVFTLIFGYAIIANGISSGNSNGIDYDKLVISRNTAPGAHAGTMTDMTAGDIVDSPFLTGNRFIKALEFGDANDVVIWESADIQDLMITNKLSVAGWVNINAGDSTGHIFRIWGTAPAKRFYMFSNAGELRVAVDGDGEGNTESKVWDTTNGALSTSAWHHVGFTFDTDVFIIYVDGAAIGAGDLDKLADWSFNTISGGTGGDLNMSNTASPVQMASANFSMWDTAVLSAADFTALYNGGAGLDPKELSPTGGANLVGSWLYDYELTYPTIRDNVLY